jgi:hypothetical protein
MTQPTDQNDPTLIDSVIDSKQTTTTTAHDACEGESVRERPHEGDWFAELTEDFPDSNPADEFPDKPVIEVDPALGKIKTTCELHGLFLNPTLSTKIDDVYDTITPPESETKSEWFEYAITEAATTDSRPKWALIEAIIQGVQASGSLVIHKQNRVDQKQMKGKIINGKRDYGNNYSGHNPGNSRPPVPASTGLGQLAAHIAGTGTGD